MKHVSALLTSRQFKTSRCSSSNKTSEILYSLTLAACRRQRCKALSPLGRPRFRESSYPDPFLCFQVLVHLIHYQMYFAWNSWTASFLKIDEVAVVDMLKIVYSDKQLFIFQGSKFCSSWKWLLRHSYLPHATCWFFYTVSVSLISCFLVVVLYCFLRFSYVTVFVKYLTLKIIHKRYYPR